MSGMSFIDGPAGRLRIEDGGTGDLPVVFVHGNGGDLTQWSAQTEHLRPGRRAVALDLRGFGASEPAADGDYSIDALADDLSTVIEALRLGRVVLAGHSIGGAVVGAYAGRHPERVAGLLLVDPSGDPTRMPREMLRAWIEGLRSDGYEVSVRRNVERGLTGSAWSVQERVFRSLWATPPEIFAGAAAGMAAYDPVPALERYPGPMLTVVSRLNREPFSLQHRVAGLPHHPIEAAGHWLMMDRPEAFNRVMDDFLDRVERSKGG
jgi:pimeloyl-ACP methyl ester carboxylesterase